MKNLLDFHYVSRQITQYVHQNLGFVLFCTLLSICYIGNYHVAIKYVHQINDAKKNLDSIRWVYLKMRSDQKQDCRFSVISQEVKALGLESSKTPPQIITVQK